MAIHPNPNRNGGTTALLAIGVKAGDDPMKLVGAKRTDIGNLPGFVVCFDIDKAWFHIGHFILMKRLLDHGRAEVAEIKQEVADADENKHQEALKNVMTKLGVYVFRHVLSFLIPSNL